MVDRRNASLSHLNFRDVAELIPEGDALIVNTTKVFRARLLGRRESGGSAEIFLLKRITDDQFEAMVHPGAKLRPGRIVSVAPGFSIEIVETTPRHTRIVKLHVTHTSELTTAVAVDDAISSHGHIPLPPYIARFDDSDDESRYQTVYADQSGSVAAPTAGLHFTPQLLAKLESQNVRTIEILLHVGPGTFRPIQHDDPDAHPMHEEWCEVSEAAAAEMNDVRARGGHLWAVGTTSARTLESATDERGIVHSRSQETTLFIRPPYTFRAVDHLITNFHLPRSTLLMLVAAFAGYDLTMRAYGNAVDEEYRFYSYGDAMCII